MTGIRPRLFLALGFILALGLQPSTARAEPPHDPFLSMSHPYVVALESVGSYQSCGWAGPPGALGALVTELHALEARAAAKGLGPELERLRRDLRDVLAVSSRACVRAGGGLAPARRAIAGFRAWVEAAPNH